MTIVRIFAQLAQLVLLTPLAVAADTSSTDRNQDVQSLLTARCQICHNEQVNAGGLALTTMNRIREGGNRGPAIVPGKPDQSLLYRLISGGQPAMPKQGEPLSKAEVESVRQWIANGAPWTEASQWWSLQPLTRPPVPNVATINPIDAFILSKLREKRLVASPEADRRTLIRRLTYDLHGLPPSPEEVDAFLTDRSPDAYEKSGRPSTRLASLWRALGTSLAGRRPLRRVAWL